MRQGDPRLIMGPDGTRLQFVAGQPLLDGGLENLALISLFTKRGWCGNGFMKAPIGSDFEDACDQPITRQALNQIRMAAEGAMTDPAFGAVTATVVNPTEQRVQVTLLIKPPAGSARSLTLTTNGHNWLLQGSDPAYLRIRPTE